MGERLRAHLCYRMLAFFCVCIVREDVLQQQHYCSRFLSYPPPPGCGQQAGTDCSVLLLYLEMTCGVIGDDDWPGEK